MPYLRSLLCRLVAEQQGNKQLLQTYCDEGDRDRDRDGDRDREHLI